MRVLITGGLGLIGSSTAEHLAAAGHNVTVVDDGRGAATDTLPTPITIHRHSVEAHAAITGTPPARRYDIVIHAAAPVGPVGILAADVLADMLSATRAAIRIARDNGAAIIALSSSEVYGTEFPGRQLVVPDEWSHRVEYGVGKIATEVMCRRHHHDTGLPTMVIRPWNVTGPRQAASKGFVLARMADQAERGEPVTVYLPGTQKRAFMHVSDLAVHICRLVDEGPHTEAPWDGVPLDAATPKNATSMIELADHYGTGYRLVDPAIEHGPLFREAAAGSKLPPHRPALCGWTPLTTIISDIRAYRRNTYAEAA